MSVLFAPSIATTLKFPLLLVRQVTDENMLYFAHAIACRLVTLG